MTRTRWMIVPTLLLAGCNVDKVDQAIRKIDKPHGAHAAQGAVTLDEGGDWQANRCDAEPDGSIVVSADNAKQLLVVQSTEPKTAVLHVPDGTTLSFRRNQCTIRTEPKGDAEYLIVDCAAGGRELRAGITLLRCGG